MSDPKTEELQIKQLKREVEEKQRAEKAELEHETDTHDRRAMKAEYLRSKLKERAEAEKRAKSEEGS